MKMKFYNLIVILICATNYTMFGQEVSSHNSADFVYKSEEMSSKISEFTWPESSKPDLPFEHSKKIKGIQFTGRFANYTKADTWYPSWASDGNLYSPWTDGSVAEMNSFSGGANAKTGQARIEGEDPMNLRVIPLGIEQASPAPYGGRYPCGSLVYNNIWYYGTYTLGNGNYGLNWPIMGPFAGFRISYDMGKTWTASPASCEPGKSLFTEPIEKNGPVKMGSPHFVDFGKNMEHSPDGKAYLVAHGATQKDQEDRKANLSWISGDQIYLARVIPSPENINNKAAYEYFAGYDKKGNAIWSNDFQQIKPLIDWNNNTGCVTMTYNAPLKKYIMCVTDGWPTVENMNTYLLESDKITGPWKIITYLKNFGPQAYFVNIPSKFISADGRKMWLCYSANFTNGENRNNPEYLKKTNPPGSAYSLSLHEIILKK
ncbi:hypothetical protein [Flavobacterium gilvum]|nr:hypothetical protein [Flavobacterium gilvum]